MPARLAALLAVAIAFAVVSAPASAVSIAGAKRQLRKSLVGEYGKPITLYACAYRGSRNRVQCAFIHNGPELDAYDTACGDARITYNIRGYRYIWRTFGVDYCGE